MVTAFRTRRLDHIDFPYVYLDATYLHVRNTASQVVSMAVVVASGVRADGDREILGLDVGDSEDEVFWRAFLTSLKKRGLSGVKLVVSDQHAGLVAALKRSFQGTAHQRCRVHFARNLLAHVPKSHADMAAAVFRTVFAQPDAETVAATWDEVRDQLASRFPKIGPLMDGAKTEVLAFTGFPRAHWSKVWSTNPLERVNKEIPVLKLEHSQPAPPDQVRDQIALWHNARTSLRKIRVQLIGELDAMIHDLPEALRTTLPARSTVRARINAVAQQDTSDVTDPLQKLRLDLIQNRLTMLRQVLAQDKTAEAELAKLVKQSGSTLPTVPGIADRAAAEILLETEDVRRFTGTGGFARFNGTAPLPASSAEGDGEPVRHRLNRGGNRRVNARLHRIAVTQLRCEPRAASSTTTPGATATPGEKPCASSSDT